MSLALSRTQLAPINSTVFLEKAPGRCWSAWRAASTRCRATCPRGPGTSSPRWPPTSPCCRLASSSPSSSSRRLESSPLAFRANPDALSPSANSSNHVLRHKVFFFVVSNSVFIADFKSDGGQTLNFGHFCLQVKNQNGRHRIRVKDVVRGYHPFKDI